MSDLLPAINVEHLTKRYASRIAVEDLSFSVRPGEIFALLGPNGAGKTTTVEILEGLRTADSGVVRVLGHDPAKGGSRLRARVGVMLQEGGVYPTMTAREAIQLFARYYPHPRNPDELLNLVGLERSREVRYRRLSGGQKQLLSLALALVGRPDVLFLDEPTAGLDPQARRATWDLITGLRDGGTTVFLTTHYLEEAERLAECVAILDRGRLIALGTPTQLVAGDTSTVFVRTATPVSEDAIKSLPSVKTVTALSQETLRIETADAKTLLPSLTACLRDQGVLALEIRVGGSSLEDVFLRLTQAETMA